jgi:hypothetical protein
MSRVFPSPRQFVVMLVLLAGTVFGALLCWIVSLLLFAWQWGRDTSRGLGLVTPEQAIAVFHAHRADCARLRELVVPVLPGGNHATAANLPAGRFERCTELLERLGAYAVASCRVESAGYDCAIELASCGNFFHRTCAEFVFAPNGVVPADRPPVGDDPDYHRFTALGDGWFLHYYTM